MSSYFLKDGTELTYEIIGNGRPVIFIPGWAGSKELYWSKIIPLIGGKKYRAIMLDQRGAGGTSPSETRPVTQDLMIDDIRDFLVGNNYKDATLVGSSQGGAIIMGYFGKYGCDEYIHSAVLVDIAPRNCVDEKDPSYTYGQYGGNWKLEDALKDIDVMRKDFEGFYRDFILGVEPELSKLPPNERENALMQYVAHIRPEELLEEYESDLHADHREAITKIEVPLAYFYAGNEDAAFTAELEDYYRERVKGPYEAVNFHESDHLFFFHRTKDFANELIQFFDKYTD